MDDALLDDDDMQFKDDEVEDEIDEAALLGLSDEELEDLDDDHGSDIRSLNETNSGRESSVLYQGSNEEDVLEVNIDADLESFMPSDLDNNYTEEISRKPSSQNLRYKENLIPITLIPTISNNRPSGTAKSDHHKEFEESNKAANDSVLLDDEESEDESFDDDRRERFKSERSNIITLTPVKRRVDIPDSLESVIDVNERNKAQAFLENERRKKNFIRTRNAHGNFRERMIRTNVPNQVRFANQNVGPRKIHVNPHFAHGVSVPSASAIAPTSHVPTIQPTVSANYGQQQQQHHHHQQQLRFPPTATVVTHTQYRHEVFTSQPPPPAVNQPKFPQVESYQVASMQQTGNTYIPNTDYRHFGGQQPHVANIMAPPPVSQPMPTWSQPPPNLVAVQHPPPQSAPQVSPPNYMYTNIAPPAPSYPPVFPPVNYQGGNFQHPVPPPVAKPEAIVQNNQWNQPYSIVPFTKPNPVFQQNINVQKKPDVNKAPNQFQSQQIRRMAQNIHMRKLVKRSANFPLKTEPMKQMRLDDSQRKSNFIIRKTNSNIKEIKLVENLPVQPRKIQTQNVRPPQMDEDEQTKQLQLKIEEQKKLRELIMKRKEERRRQMAAQRLQDITLQQVFEVPPPKANIKTRIGIPPSVSTANSVIQTFTTIVQKRVPQMMQKPPMIQVAARPNVSVHQRIGLKNSVIAKNIPPNQGQRKQFTVGGKKLVMPQTQRPGLIVKTNPMKKTTIVSVHKKILLRSKKVLMASNTNLANRIMFQKQVRYQKQPPLLANPPNRNVRPQNMNVFRGPNVPPNRNTSPSTWQHGTPQMNARFPRPPFEVNRLSFPFPPNQGQRMPLAQPHFSPDRAPQNYFGPAQFNGPRPLLDSPRPGMGNTQPGFNGPRPVFNNPPPVFNGSRPVFNGPRMDGPQHFMDRPQPFIDRPRPFYDGPRPFMSSPRPYSDGGNSRHFMDGPRTGNFMFPQFQQPPPRFPPHGEQQPRNMPPGQLRSRMPSPRHPTSSPRHPSPSPRHPSPSDVKKQMHLNKEPNSKQKKPPSEATVPEKTLKKEPVVKTNPTHSLPKVPNVKTKIVNVTNLSSSTTEAQLKNLSDAIGPVENIELDKENRKAIITFKQEQHAANFQQKYQRYMLDLALIEVSLQPI